VVDEHAGGVTPDTAVDVAGSTTSIDHVRPSGREWGRVRRGHLVTAPPVPVGMKLRRRAAVVAVMSVASVSADTSTVVGQEGSSNEGDVTEQAVVEIDVDAAVADRAAIAGALDEMASNVQNQLGQLELAQTRIDQALADLTDRASAVAETEARIEAIVLQSDDVVIRSFMNPPADTTLDLLSADTAADATVKQALLEMQSDTDATVIENYQDERTQLIEDKELKAVALEEAEEAKADAEAALADLEAAVSQQTTFILAVRDRLDGGDPAAGDADPGLVDALTTKLQQIEEAEAQAEALRELEEAQQRRIAQGEIVCPVRGPVNFTDTWGAARSGGRSHQGTDMLADTGIPTVAPTNGEVVHRNSSLGGLSWYVYGDNGHTYYGTHLSGYENVGVGHVTAGTVIGYVGDSGNAAGTPHLHFEFQPGGGSSVNPYSLLDRACPDH
jgi:murein DD-endopeptidase MepM/ murein hydrolase activator NlpD